FGDPQRPIRTISEDAMRRLMAYDWPGNVRELENAVERAVALGSGPILQLGDLPSNLQQGGGDKSLDSDELTTLDEMERRAHSACAAGNQRRQAGGGETTGHRQDH